MNNQSCFYTSKGNVSIYKSVYISIAFHISETGSSHDNIGARTALAL